MIEGAANTPIVPAVIKVRRFIDMSFVIIFSRIRSFVPSPGQN
ncbi:hypothetical protein [Ensifer sp.]|nr:hypothetical protein [Ensifer sp.]